MKVLLAIAHYGSKNRKFLMRCLREYNSFQKYTFEVHLYVTEEFNLSEFSNLTIYLHIYPLHVGENLVLQHRDMFVANRDKFDYYMYYEDDVLITESIFDSYIDVQNKLPLPYVCGFLRYENKTGNDRKFLIDNLPVNSCLRWGITVVKENYTINGEKYFEVYNFHQGGYLFPKRTMNFVFDSTNYLVCHDFYAGRALEGAASDVFRKCGVIKVIPRNRVSELVVHHLPDKYVNTHEAYTEESTPDDKQIALMQPRHVNY